MNFNLSFGIRSSQLICESVDNLRRSGRRAVLSLCGIAAGCAAVIALLNIGHILEIEALSVFRGMGSDLLVTNVQLPIGNRADAAPNVETLDTTALRQESFEIVAASPLIINSLDARLRGRALRVTLLGTNAELVSVLDLELAQGRFFSSLDAKSTHVVIGSNVVERWKQVGIPVSVGDEIAIGGYLFQVIGMLQSSGENPLLPVIVDDAILISQAGTRRIVAAPQINTVLVRSASGDASSRIAGQLQQWLERAMPYHTIVVQIPEQLIEGMARQSRLFSRLLAGVGAIALLVGGIGVMNVMVMSVTERRREIGVRMAIGARPIDIAALFLFESVLLAITGAMAGAALGVITAWAFVYFSGWSSFALSWSAVILGMGSAVLTGLFFGLSPAMAAARLTPTQALRDD